MRAVWWMGLTAGCSTGFDIDEDALGEACDAQNPQASFAWYPDEDGDGYGAAVVPQLACERPLGFVSNDDDCDDTRASVHPDAPEICNDGLDDNCNGFADDRDPGLDPTSAETFHADLDGDGFGDPDAVVMACGQPERAVVDATDCDDLDPDVNPEAVEICNGGIDDDCDTLADDADDSLDAQTTSSFWADSDGDGFGDPDASVAACVAPEAHVANDDDCDDTLLQVNPDAVEICNGGVDDDCNGWADDGDPGVDPYTATTWFADADLDGFGDPAVATLTCVAPDGFVADGQDCDDTDAFVFPTAPERCNLVDDDCDPATEGSGAWLWDPAFATWSDLTPDFDLGTAAAPVDVVIPAAGDLYVCAGTHHVRLDAAEDLTLVGPDGAASTTLDGGLDVNGSTEPLVELGIDTACSISGLTLSNARHGIDALRTDLEIADAVFRAIGDGVSQGIAIDHSVGELVVRRTEFTELDGFSALRSELSSVTIEGTTLTDNRAEGALVRVVEGFVDVVDGTLTDNDALHTLELRESEVEVRGTTLERNDGGGLRISGGTFTVDDLRAVDNDGVLGGGLYLGAAGTASNLEITGNTAVFGGGIYVDGVVELTDAVVHDNSAVLRGGGVEVEGTGGQSLQLDRIDVTDNHSFGDGGGIAAIDGSLELVDALIEGNTSDADGGGIWMEIGDRSLTLDDSTIASNSALLRGGGVYVEGGRAVLTPGQVALTSSLVTLNAADDGGGLYAEEGDLEITCTGVLGQTHGFLENDATFDGGALYLRSRLDELTPVDVRSFQVAFDAVDCDLGTLLGGDDNAPDDVFFDEVGLDCVTNPGTCQPRDNTTSSNYGDDQTFCLGFSC